MTLKLSLTFILLLTMFGYADGQALRPEPDTLSARQDVGAEEGDEDLGIAVYLDCSACDFSHIRREIAFVNWARDRKDADVHLLIATRAAAAGREYTLYFIGLRTFSALQDTLRFASSDTDTGSESRSRLVQSIRQGLVRYVSRTPQADRIGITYRTSRLGAAPQRDPWKYWTFRISANGSYEEEEATRSFEAGGSVGASRITDSWKIQLSSSGNYSESEFDFEDGVFESTSRSGSAKAQAIKSLGKRWSAGLFASGSTSSFNNTDYSATLAPAVEFNVFPYSESTRREFRVAYYLNLRSFDYAEITVFGKTEEEVLHQSAEAIFRSTEPWGSAYVSLKASNYLTDFEESLTDLYRIEFYSYMEVRLVRGLSLWVEGSASRIRDQIYLPLRSASEEEILLGTIQLPTDFSLQFSGGISFTFGSIYNNIVNPRFGG